jgi:glutamyl-tRNA synthetase
MAIINEVVSEVNAMPLDEQLAKLKSSAPELLEKKPVEKKGLKPLPEYKGSDKVCMRFEPSPSGPMHIGHAYPASLNFEYAKENKGSMILRISDTNPENIDPEAYDLIKNDADWLFGEKGYKFFIQSDRMDIYYKYAEELLEKDAVYICSCDSEDFRNLLQDKTACPCRSLSKEENKKRWEKMLDGSTPAGGSIVRFKSDIAHKNPAMRDFPLMRINEASHPKTSSKYRVWPLMNFSVAIDDMDMKVTHTLRGKDHADNAKKQAMVHEVLGYQTPVAINVGRINFEGFPVSCSKTKALIAEGKYEGWEDIRIPFLIPIRKRGYSREAIIEYAKEVGVTQTDKSVNIDEYFKTLNSINKSILDAKTKRYFFIDTPVKIKIKGAPFQSIALKSHPDSNEKTRKFKTKEDFYITADDMKQIDLANEEDIFRLMDCLNIKKYNDELIFNSLEVEKFKGRGRMIIHWLPAEETIEVKVRMPDGSLKKGLAELSVKEIVEGDVIQFERFGFCRLEEKENLEFWFAHK